MAELLQHEYDHLDGILATMRAIDEKSFRWRESPG
jgi:peptide deformylase